VMSQEADFVWGIDKNEQSVKFAKEAFTRVKNGIYYNAQVSFDQFDVISETRETMKFDLVATVETIEHISDHKKFLEQIIRFDKKDNNNPTEYFISTPNRNNNAPARGYLRAWGINGEAFLKDTGDPELVMSRVWQVHDDLYNTISKDDTLNGAAFSSALTGFSFDINTSGRDVNGQLFFVVGFGVLAEEIA